MALKNYEWRGHTWQFEEGEQPADAKPVKAKAEKSAKVADKVAKPADKAAAAAKKEG